MRLVYIDDAQDPDTKHIAVSAVVINAADWRTCHDHWTNVRMRLEESHGLRRHAEIHGTDLWNGKKNKFLNGVRRPHRVETMGAILEAACGIPGVTTLNAFGLLSKQTWVWERLFTRIDRTMQEVDDLAFIICDEGKPYDDLLWQLRNRNVIRRADGSLIDRPLKRIVEDIFYRNSRKSNFVQVADLCSYAVLRRSSHNDQHRALGAHRLSERMESMCYLAANPAHPLGIIEIL